MISQELQVESDMSRVTSIGDVVPVARLEDFRALKSSNLEDFRVLKPYGQIGGFEGPKILQIGGF